MCPGSNIEVTQIHTPNCLIDPTVWVYRECQTAHGKGDEQCSRVSFSTMLPKKADSYIEAGVCSHYIEACEYTHYKEACVYSQYIRACGDSHKIEACVY